jgi:hypothetical protein
MQTRVHSARSRQLQILPSPVWQKPQIARERQLVVGLAVTWWPALRQAERGGKRAVQEQATVRLESRRGPKPREAAKAARGTPNAEAARCCPRAESTDRADGRHESVARDVQVHDACIRVGRDAPGVQEGRREAQRGRGVQRPARKAASVSSSTAEQQPR